MTRLQLLPPQSWMRIYCQGYLKYRGWSIDSSGSKMATLLFAIFLLRLYGMYCFMLFVPCQQFSWVFCRPSKHNWTSLGMGLQRRLRRCGGAGGGLGEGEREWGALLVLYSFTDEAVPLILSTLSILIYNYICISPSRWLETRMNIFQILKHLSTLAEAVFQ